MEGRLTAKAVMQELEQYIIPEKAAFFPRFFKTGKGQYGEGDLFIGVTVPSQHKVARMFKMLPLAEIQKLLDSKIHEHRLTGIMILCLQYAKAKTVEEKHPFIDFYLKNTYRVNNWDLVDSSAHIVGLWEIETGEELLEKLSRSEMLWEQRISIVGTYPMIKANKLALTFKIAESFLTHKHDLMHKAVGWMLREAGKRDISLLVSFLDRFATKMPRTMLRYAIEKFPEDQRQYYLKLRSVNTK
ncbi:MAG: DNA alkylation repair protein [Candidatus Dojkabacteria bacterium]|nr:MAG: DNA alkylation repair protein [Candidatus Dojkabacteria bacterium]